MITTQGPTAYMDCAAAREQPQTAVRRTPLPQDPWDVYSMITFVVTEPE